MSASDLSSLTEPTAMRLDVSFVGIDWHAPWLCHINEREYLAQQVAALSTPCAPMTAQDKSEPSATALNHDSTLIADILNTIMAPYKDATPPAFVTTPTADTPSMPLTFVSQNALPAGEGYESFIAKTGNIPTRDNLHDLFNGSIWLTFPKTKALLNCYHMREIAAGHDASKHAGRGRVRDTITVFDENGAVLVTAHPDIGTALKNFDWQGSLASPRKIWDDPKHPRADAQAAVYIFGHALLEQLIEPRKPLCAHSIVLDVTPDFFALSTSERMAELDERLAVKMDDLLSQDQVMPRHLSPLPILGVPHFWAANRERAFYDDDFVFRRGRRKKSG